MEWQNLAWGRPADAAAGGLIVLAVGSLAARLCRQPVRRARLVALTLLGGVAVPCLGALPVAPRWSAGLIPAAAPLGYRPDEEAHTVARGRLRPPEAEGSREVAVFADRFGETPTEAARPCPRPIGTGEAPSRVAVGGPPRADGPVGVLSRRGGRVGGLVVRRAGRALAGNPGGSPRPGSGARRLPRPHRARG